MKKKIYIVLLCMMMILSLVGCSKSQKSNDANSNTNILSVFYFMLSVNFFSSSSVDISNAKAIHDNS